VKGEAYGFWTLERKLKFEVLSCSLGFTSEIWVDEFLSLSKESSGTRLKLRTNNKLVT
jgi:hypothetical protein